MVETDSFIEMGQPYQRDSHGQIIASTGDHEDPPPTERYVGVGDFPDAMPYLLSKHNTILFCIGILCCF